jgi:hypothetical protein
MSDPTRREGNGRVDPRALGERLEAARRYFREHHVDVRPDAGFAERVAASVERARPEVVGTLALRLLPASLALAIALAWWTLSTTARTVPTAAETALDPLTWVLDVEQDAAP